MRKVTLGFDSSDTWRFTDSVVAHHVPGAIISGWVPQPLAASSPDGLPQHWIVDDL
jgi:hypothetical protein